MKKYLLQLWKLFVSFADKPGFVTRTNLDFVLSVRFLLIFIHLHLSFADPDLEILFIRLMMDSLLLHRMSASTNTLLEMGWKWVGLDVFRAI